MLHPQHRSPLKMTTLITTFTPTLRYMVIRHSLLRYIRNQRRFHRPINPRSRHQPISNRPWSRHRSNRRPTNSNCHQWAMNSSRDTFSQILIKIWPIWSRNREMMSKMRNQTNSTLSWALPTHSKTTKNRVGHGQLSSSNNSSKQLEKGQIDQLWIEFDQISVIRQLGRQ